MHNFDKTRSFPHFWNKDIKQSRQTKLLVRTFNSNPFDKTNMFVEKPNASMLHVLNIAKKSVNERKVHVHYIRLRRIFSSRVFVS